MNIEEQVEKSIEEAMKFLVKRRQKNGNFLSFTFGDKNNFRNAEKHFSTFPSSLILLCLNTISDIGRPNIEMRKKLAEFLLSEKSAFWSFNYWQRNSKDAKKSPYPDDLDDTFCALSALFQYDEKLIDGKALADIVSLLTMTEEKEGGPYRTWLVTEGTDPIWKDIDIAVNSNIAYFLSLQDVSLPNIDAFIEKAIDEEKYFSPYYASPYSVIYFISRFYKGIKKEKIMKYILKNMGKICKLDNPLDTALAVSSLLNFEYSESLNKSAEYLLKSQKNGFWKSYPFCVELIKNKKTYYSGSSELTTAFCAEALAKIKYQKLNIRNTNQKEKIKDDDIYKHIVKKAKKRFSFLDKELKENSLKILNRILKIDNPRTKRAEQSSYDGNDKQIILLPFLFKETLANDAKQKISDDLIEKLGLANLYGWIAYTIYDDFLDENGNPRAEQSSYDGNPRAEGSACLPVGREQSSYDGNPRAEQSSHDGNPRAEQSSHDGNPVTLSSANLCLRELSEIFGKTLPKNKEFQEFWKNTMDKIDGANAWEVSNCKINFNELKAKNYKPTADFSDYSKLAEKSFGHALGPIAILFALGYGKDSEEIKNIILFFKHYIIARQLNDDAHDWEEDLKNGRLNPISVKILEKYKIKNKNFPAQDLKIKKILPELQQIFWKDIVLAFEKDVLFNISLAKKALNKIKILKDRSLFEKMLSPIENSAKKTLAEQKETIKFLKRYQKNI